MIDYKNYRAPQKSTLLRDCLLTIAIICAVLLLSHLDNEERQEGRVRYESASTDCG